MPLGALTIEKIKDFSKAEVLDFSVMGKTHADELITLLKKTIPETTYQKPSIARRRNKTQWRGFTGDAHRLRSA